jgi:hypothetical protein
MRRFHYFVWKQRKGIALLLVMFIAFASLVLLTTLFASLAPRRASVSGDAQADRVLAVADGKIDLIIETINTLPQVNVSGLAAENDIQSQIVAGWEGMLNGYANASPNNLSNGSNVTAWFYRASTNTWYALWNTTDTTHHMMNIQTGTKLGRQVGPADSPSGTVLGWVGLKDLSSGGGEIANSVIGIDPNCRTDNDWFEVDTNAVYNLAGTSDVWTITASAYLLSRTAIVKTVEAKADKSFTITPTEDYNWFTMISRTGSFSDFVFLDDFDVNFGKYSNVYCYVHANGTVNMGGYAAYPVSSTQHVTDYAVDDNNRSDGTFGPSHSSLSWAKSNSLNGNLYAKDNAAAIPWLKVGNALTGLQGAAVAPSYNVSGNATVTFSIVSGVGKVTIKIGSGLSNTYAMPANGIIYVSGDATVSGGNSTSGVPGVLGRCIVGAGGDISIGGDILYNIPPRTAETNPSTNNPDFLGLVSSGNIQIPYSTFLADKNLVIDAAMVADGWMGIDPSNWTSWHNLNTDPGTAPTLVVQGSMAAGDGSQLFATTSGGQIKGYDLRQYNFDWNLKQVGVPIQFPTTGTGTTSTETLVTLESMQGFGIVSSSADYSALLAQLVNPSSHPATSPLTVNGRAYYATPTTVGGPSTWEGTGLVTIGLYRIGWKEQIGKAVTP